MAGTERHLSLKIPWTTLLKVLAAVALVWVFRELVWLVMVVLIAVIIAVGLAPIVSWLEQRRWPRWLAASGVVMVLLAAIVGFLLMTWSSLSREGADLEQRLGQVEQEVLSRAPESVVVMVRRSDTPVASVVLPYAESIGRSLLSFVTEFVLAWILVVYLLIEAEMTYRWVRGFVRPARRARFDQTAIEARDAAAAYIVGNIVTSICAAAYVFTWMSILHVPAALLLALIAFVFDFVPVLGFFFSCAPAVAMATLVSPTVGIMTVPIYVAYHFVENYLIGPRVYGSRLRLSNVAVLIAFTVGAELGGVAGALLALPIAAVYPAIERLWLREPFGEEVVQEHERLRARGA
jgi:predicted PurR-regulated permease PerM